MASPEERELTQLEVGARRGRGAVAASIVAVLLIGAYFAASEGNLGAMPGEYVLNAALLVVAFWFPAMRIGSVRDVARQWAPLLVWLLAWTLVWDLATSGIFAVRSFLQEWWIVYPTGVGVLGALLVLHGAVVAWSHRRRTGRGD